MQKQKKEDNNQIIPLALSMVKTQTWNKNSINTN